MGGGKEKEIAQTVRKLFNKIFFPSGVNTIFSWLQQVYRLLRQKNPECEILLSIYLDAVIFLFL